MYAIYRFSHTRQRWEFIAGSESDFWAKQLVKVQSAFDVARFQIRTIL